MTAAAELATFHLSILEDCMKELSEAEREAMQASVELNVYLKMYNYKNASRRMYNAGKNHVDRVVRFHRISNIKP